MQHPDFDVNGWIRREMERLMGDEEETNSEEPLSLEKTPYHHETQPAFGEHGAWQEWYIHHSNCGGTWVYVKEPGNDRVICSCSMGMGRND